jgi:hypothetical protein
MQSTITTLQLRDAFVTAIVAIVPTMEALRDVRWSYVPSPRKNGQAAVPSATRNFDLSFRNATPTYLWNSGIGTAYEVRLAVTTSYAGVEPETLEHLLVADAVDLRRALNQLRDPTLPGLYNVIALGLANEQLDNEAGVLVDHVFAVHYHQATE